VTRSLGILSLVIVAAIGAWVFSQQAKTAGPSSPTVQQAVVQAQSAVAGTNFAAATEAMQAWFVQNETYAGATLPPGSGVVLVRADATSYCLQTGAPGESVEHETGRGGLLQPGAC
jgi:hypothetical protein